ncbi:MAG: exodeoxyribonuclease VII large subunit [Verrucomicrobia bacterium]|nr:exodeoxyribonuclease VII large subunit [Verrucomicrobiota bacterium]
MASILTVSELTRVVREVLEGRIGEVWVEGEISNYRKQSSGHHYFTLKDDRAQLACVMFARSYGAQTRMSLADGMQVQVYGQVTVYEARGQYQLIVRLLQPKGQGVLQAKFEALKQKLQAEGLFDPDRKRSLPKFPRRVALVTSPTGAAVQDMINILRRRSPWLSILICPVRVQGEGAALEISRTIDYVSSRAAELKLDVMIVGRGGGNLEDLWEFNEEIVARSIFRSRIPVISAVGHEIDFTIADFVADRRAPTPSAAAEIVAPDIIALQSELISRSSALDRLVRQALEIRQIRLQRLAGTPHLRDPRRLIFERQQRVDQLEMRLVQFGKSVFQQRRARIERIRIFLSAFRPDRLLQAKRAELAALGIRLGRSLAANVEFRKNRVTELANVIRLLGPQQTLERGYSITLDVKGNVIRSVQDMATGDSIQTKLTDGTAKSVVEEVASLHRSEILRDL